MGHLLYSGSDRFKVLDLLDNVPEEQWTEEPAGYSPWDHKESDTTEGLTLTLSVSLC